MFPRGETPGWLTNLLQFQKEHDLFASESKVHVVVSLTELVPEF